MFIYVTDSENHESFIGWKRSRNSTVKPRGDNVHHGHEPYFILDFFTCPPKPYVCRVEGG